MFVWQQNRSNMDYLRRRAENMINRSCGPITESAASYGDRPPARDAHKVELQSDNAYLWELSGAFSHK